jgi:hypothetical protein
MPVGSLNPTRTPSPAARNVPTVEPKHQTDAEKNAANRAAKAAAADAKAVAHGQKLEQARADRLKREEDAKQIALAKIDSAGAPQKALNSALSGIENIQRLITGDPGSVGNLVAPGAPAGTPDASSTGAPSILSRLISSVGLPILVGLAVTALWYFLKPKH